MCVLLVAVTLAFGVPVKSCPIAAPYAGWATINPSTGGEIRVANRYARFLTAATTPSTAKAEAVYVLAHELGHLRNPADAAPAVEEARADRWARLNWCFVVSRLGYPNCRGLWSLLPSSWRALGLNCRVHFKGC